MSKVRHLPMDVFPLLYIFIHQLDCFFNSKKSADALVDLSNTMESFCNGCCLESISIFHNTALLWKIQESNECGLEDILVHIQQCACLCNLHITNLLAGAL